MVDWRHAIGQDAANESHSVKLLYCLTEWKAYRELNHVSKGAISLAELQDKSEDGADWSIGVQYS